MENILEIKNLTKKYSDFTLDDISFNLKKGYIMGLIGPNGSGKTTIIKLIMNLIQKTGGEIKIFGHDYGKYEREIKQRIGVVYDQNYYYENLNALEIQRIIASFYKHWDKKVFSSYLKRFDLPDYQKISKLSKGMKTKFSLAMALSHQAELIIMDEPSSGLDPVFRQELQGILTELIQDENKSVLFSTHITSDLDRTADYITFINKGKLVFSAEKDRLLDNYGIVKGSNELLNEDIKTEFIGIRQTSVGFEALTANAPAIRRLFKEKVVVERPTIEDIMVYTIKGELQS
ncbi:MAG: ABC transporter ATP-binding protein [Desulfotomaculum sp.]|nr:ABC transporter ATP-binding protein [Desulfotomaculum sp.]